MSDSPQAEGWWQASDGKYYPPELHPDVQGADAPAETPATADGAAAEGSPGEGYWQASDGNWYPPELHPDASGGGGDGGGAEPGGAEPATPTAEDPEADEPAAPTGRETIFMPGTPSPSDGPPPASPPSSTPQPPPAEPPSAGPPPGSEPASSPPGAGGQPPASPPPAAPPPGPPPAAPPPAAPSPAAPPPGPPPATPPPGGPPPAGPPPGPGAPPPAGGGEKKKGKAGKIILIILLVIALAVAAFAVNAIFFGDEASADVLLEPIADERDDPFTDPVAPEPAGSLADYASGPGQENDDVTVETAGYRSPDGSVPGVYGGTLNEASCDVAQLETFLAAEPEVAAVWASVVQISPADISAYLASLTPVNLSSDTRVVNHGFADGEAVPRQSVLQRGSAVLSDARGVPRVDCYAGSPLLEPEPQVDESFDGDAWSNFEEEGIVVVVSAPSELSEFELLDFESGDTFVRPVGSRGDADRSGTVDLIDGEQVDFNTTYEDVLHEARTETRYLLDVPDGAVMNLTVANQRDSASGVDVRIVARGDTFLSENRIAPGAEYTGQITLDHDDGGEFEILFSRGAAAFEWAVELEVQNDAGAEGDAGDGFDTAFPIDSGQRVEGQIRDQDTTDVYLLDVQPGTELQVSMENLRGSSGDVDIEVRLADDNLMTERRIGPAGTYENALLLSGEDQGVLEIIVSRGASDYAFTATLVEQQDAGQAGDAGNDRVSALQIPIGQGLAGQAGDRDPADWFLFEAPAAGVEIVITNDIGSPGDLDALVEDGSADNQAVERRISPGTETSLMFEAEPGEEYWLILGQRGRANYAFEIREAPTSPE